MDALLGLWILALAIGGYAFVVRRTGDPLHPLGVLTAGWLGIFAFAHFSVPRSFDEPYYAEPFGPATYLVVLSGLATFVLGFLLIERGLHRVDQTAVAARLRRSLDRGRLGGVTLVLLVVATLTTVHFVRVAGEIPLFSPRIDELRRTFKLPLLGYLYDLHYAVALFGAMLVSWSPTRRARLFWAGVVSVSMLQLMFGGVRVSPMTALTWVVVFVAYRPGGARKRHALVAVLMAALLFGVIEQFRRSIYERDPSLMNPRLDLSAPATVWAHSAASFKNLQLTLDRGVSPLHMGLTSYDLPKTLHPPARAVDQQLSYLFGTHNTPTFLSFLFFDFGWGGMLVIPVIYGALTALVYARFRDHTSVVWLLVYIDFLLAVALAFRTHRFLGNSLIFFLGIAVLVQIVAGRSGAAVGEGTDAESGPGADLGRDPLPVLPRALAPGGR